MSSRAIFWGRGEEKGARKRVPDLEIEFVGTGVPDGPFCRNFNEMLANESYVIKHKRDFI
jgi:hypothetical protein